jgi:hypothetical protein
MFFGLHNFKELNYFHFLSLGSIKLLGSQAILLRSTKRHESTNGWIKKSNGLSTISTNLGSIFSSHTSCSKTSRTRSRCLLINHFTHWKHMHHALYLATFSV